MKIASMIGLAASVVSLGLAIWLLDFWIGLLAVFAAMRCWTGIRQAEALKLLEQAPRHHDAACPSCQARPPVGPFWFCPNCRVTFDPFMHMATCPNCGTRFPETQCLECQTAHPLMQWYQPAKPAPVSEDHNPEPRW